MKRAIKYKRKKTELGLPYSPASESCNSLQVDVPDSMGYEMHEALRLVKKAVGGSINDFVCDRLAYSPIELCKVLAAEQIDAVALAIYNIEAKGQSLIIGDQTGIGKGRQAAAMIRYHVLRGEKPILLTLLPDLFTDMYRDLVDIGSGNLKPYIVNGKEAKTDISDKNGKVVYTALNKTQQDKIVKDVVTKRSNLPLKEYDFIISTYSQFQTQGIKQDFLQIISKNNPLILDEAHTASGNSNTGELMMSAVSGASAVTFLSGTFAKRPDNMPLYAIKTAMSEANMTDEELVNAILKGGVALQEVLSAQLVKEGQMIRRERNFDGIELNYVVLENLEKEHRLAADNITEILRDIISFQTKEVDKVIEDLDKIAVAEYKEVEKRKGTKGAGVDSTPYFSKVFNVINQMLFSIKAEAVANIAIQRLKQGKKPVIAFSSTMGSFLEDLGVKEGDTIPADFTEVLQKGLDGVLRYTERNEMGETESKMLNISELNEEAQNRYFEIQEKIQKASTGISISPIDIITGVLKNNGYTFAEVTGRKHKLQLNLSNEKPTKTAKSKSNSGITSNDLGARLKRLMPKMQQAAIMGNDELIEVVERLNKMADEFPKIYDTEKKYNKLKKENSEVLFDDVAIAHAHFSIGNTDWYVLEWDGKNEMYGYTILNGDLQNAEYGYINLTEIHSIKIRNYIIAELDYFFTPVPMSKIKEKKGISGFGLGCVCKDAPKRVSKFKNFLGKIDTVEVARKKFMGLVLDREVMTATKAFWLFNNNEVDVLLINQKGGTGVSAHAVPTDKVAAKDVKQRVFLDLQPELDINKQVQKMGRVNRTGQIKLPIYDFVSSAIPAEKRLTMMLQRKLKSLNANTTSNQKQNTTTTDIDFLNKIGDDIVAEYVLENPEIAELLGIEIKDNKIVRKNGLEDFALFCSGRVAVLSTDLQAKFYNEISERYAKRVEYLKQTGEYDLEVETMDLKAEVLSTRILKAGRGGLSSFGEDSIEETVSANVLKKPYTQKELKSIIDAELNGLTPEEYQRKTIEDFKNFVASKTKQDVEENNERYQKLIADIPNERKIKAIADKAYREMAIQTRTEELTAAKTLQQESLITKHNNNQRYLLQFFNYYIPFRGINYPVSGFDGTTTSVSAVFVGYGINKSRNNPYAPSAIDFKIALSDSNKFIALAASGDTGQKLNAIIGTSIRLSDYEAKNIFNEWDSITKESNVNRKRRYIITGNLLQAYSSGNGKLISYTTNTGETKKGILLPENYQPDFKEQKVTVPISATLDIIKSLQAGTNITTTNGVSINKNYTGNDFTIYVTATKKGSWLYLDANVLGIVETNNFNKISDQMQAKISSSNIDEFVAILSEKHRVSVALSTALYETIADKLKDEKTAVNNFPSLKTNTKKIAKSSVKNDVIELAELEAEALMLELELLQF